MPVAVAFKVKGVAELERRLKKISPRSNRAWVRRALVASANEVQRIATEEMIIRGGAKRGKKGPRGGRGKIAQQKPHPTKVTSRTGTLRRSIRVNRGPLPYAIDVGSDLKYAAVHELGKHGRISGFPKRPFLQPALEKASKHFSRLFVREWRKEFP